MEAAREFLTVSNDRDRSASKALLSVGSETDSAYSSPCTPSGEFGTDVKPHESHEAHAESPSHKAQNLGHRPKKKLKNLIVNLLPAVLPILFIVLAICSLYLDRRHIRDYTWGHQVQSAIKLGPSIYPVIFAFLIRQFLDKVALFMAERGTRLGYLEQLLGSQTVLRALELQVRLGALNILGLCLMVLWGLSPIGGQASLRLLLQGTSNTTEFRNITYLSTDPIAASNTDPAAEYDFLLNSLYSAALFERYDEQSGSMDIWGNVKIPTIEPLLASGEQDSAGWLSVDANSSKPYSSLVGIPVSGLNVDANSSFSIESYYLVLDCPTLSIWDHGPETPVPMGGFLVEIEGILPSNEDSSTLYAGANSYPTLELPKVGFASGSTINGDKDFVANCTMSRSSVESNVLCNGMACSVVRMRKSRYDTRPPAYTSLATQNQADMFAKDWAGSAGILAGGQSSPTEFFIQDPTLKHLMTPGHLQGNASLAGISSQEFSQVFSLLFNTYWQCWLMPYWQTGNLPSNITQFNEESFRDNFAVPIVVNSTGAAFTFSAGVYVCDKYWASTLIVVSSILVCCTLGGALLDYRTSSPKIFGYVSSLTRDNPYFDQPTGGSTLDGLKRSKVLRDVKVCIQDVAGDEKARHIAFTTVERGNRRGVPGIGLYQG